MTTSKQTQFLLPLLAIAIMIAGNLACANIVNIEVNQPPRTVEYSDDALDSFNNKWRDVLLETPLGPFSATFTEEELNAAVLDGIQVARDSGYEVPVENVQVILENNQISVYGRASVDVVEANGVVSISPTVSSDGRITLAITQAEFGLLEIDAALLETLRSTLESTINQPMTASGKLVILENIVIEDGLLTLSGIMKS